MTQELAFTVQGEHGTYNVIFQREGDNMRASCTCPAGINKQYCKHRFALMRGEGNAVISDNRHDVTKIPEMLKGTDVEKALIDLAESEKVYERQVKAAKGALAEKKKTLAKAMSD